MTGINGVSAVNQPSDDRLITFAVGDDNHLYERFTPGVWVDHGLPPNLDSIRDVSGPSAVYQPSTGRLETKDR